MVPSNETTTPNPKSLSSSSSSSSSLMITTNNTSFPSHTPPPNYYSNKEIEAALAIQDIPNAPQEEEEEEDERRKGKKKVVVDDDTDDYFMGLLPLHDYTSATQTTPYESHYIDHQNPLYSDHQIPPFDRKGKRKVDDYIIISESEDETELDYLNLQNDGDHDLQLESEPVYIDIDNDDDDDDDDNVADLVPVPFAPVNLTVDYWQRNRRKQAVHFACPSPENKHGGESSSSVLPVVKLENEIDGPFSEALKGIQERITKSMKIRECVVAESVSKKRKREEEEEENVGGKVWVPSLLELSLTNLAKHSDEIVSLDGVPDELRHRISKLLCDSRKGDARFLQLLLSGSPTDIRLRDCSWLTEEQFTNSFRACDTARLEVLQLDQCGRCITDYTILDTLVQSPSCLPRLVNLSLSGACRLTDKGLQAIVASTPVLRSINLSQCSLLTYASLNILADTLGPILKELYLDDCLLIDAALIVLPLKRLEHLEVLSLAGIQTVCDGFIKDYIIVCGHRIKELVLKDCIKLTDASIKVIAVHCPGLQALDLMNLSNLTDFSIGYLTNSCRELHTLKLCRNPFSDEAIAAFLETTGESLTELSLNNIKKVDQQTALSLARHGKNLHTLDLSWCRNLTENDLGLIVDSCSSLRLLKLFGCTQVTDVFLNRHLKPEIQTIGLKLSPLTEYVRVFNHHHQGALRYSPASVDSDIN